MFTADEQPDVMEKEAEKKEFQSYAVVVRQSPDYYKGMVFPCLKEWENKEHPLQQKGVIHPITNPEDARDLLNSLYEPTELLAAERKKIRDVVAAIARRTQDRDGRTELCWALAAIDMGLTAEFIETAQPIEDPIEEAKREERKKVVEEIRQWARNTISGYHGGDLMMNANGFWNVLSRIEGGDS